GALFGVERRGAGRTDRQHTEDVRTLPERQQDAPQGRVRRGLAAAGEQLQDRRFPARILLPRSSVFTRGELDETRGQGTVAAGRRRAELTVAREPETHAWVPRGVHDDLAQVFEIALLLDCAYQRLIRLTQHRQRANRATNQELGLFPPRDLRGEDRHAF